MNARKLKVRVNLGAKDSDNIIHDVAATRGNTPVKIKAVKGAKYILQDAEKPQPVAPHEVKVWRVGKDLHMRFADNPNEVVIEDYYAENADEVAVLGQAEDGKFYPFVSEDPEAIGEIANLPDGGNPVDAALGIPDSSGVGAVAASGGISPWWLAAGLIGVGAAAGGHGGGGSTPSKVPYKGVVIKDFAGLEHTGDVQGYIHAGDHTTDTAPTFNGAGLTKGDIVKIYDTVDGIKTLLGSTVVGADGQWSYTPTKIVTGVHSVTFTDTPVNGSEGDPSAALIFIVDAIPNPVPPTTFSLAVTDGESFDFPVLGGTGDEWDVVTISDTFNGVTTIIGTAVVTTVNGHSVWSFTPPTALAEGDHQITCTESSQDTPIDVKSVKITVKSTGNSVSTVETAVAVPTEDVSLTSTQPLTSLSTMAQITGSLSASSTTGSGANQTNATTINYGGVATANASVQVTINGKVYTTTADATGKYSITIPATDRLTSNVTWVPQIRVTDPVSHAVTTVAGTAFKTDYNAPVGSTIRMTDATDSSITNWSHSYGTTNNKTPVFTGSAEAGSTVALTIGGKTYITTASSSGSYSFAIPAANALSEGSYSPMIKVTDLAGNSATVTGLSVTIDTTAPKGETVHLDTTSITGTSSFMTSNNTPVLSGVAEAGALVAVTINGHTYSTIASATGTYQIKVTDTLLDGKYTPTVTVTDKAGNSSSVTGTEIVVATHVPTGTEMLDAASDTGVSNTDGITYINTPTLVGETGAGNKVSILLNGHTYTATADATGHYSVKVTDPLPGGNSITYIPKVTITDGANNSTTFDGQHIILKTGGDDWGQPNGLTTNVPKDSNSDGVLTASEAFQGGNFLKVQAHFDTATCVVGDVVTVTDGVNKYSVALTATALAAGYVSFDVPIPPAGVKTTYLASLTDIAGNVTKPDLAHSASITYVDKPNGNVAPTVTITTDANHDGYLNAAEINGQTSLQVRIGFDPASAGVNQQVYLNGVNVAVLTAADVARGYITTTIPTPATGTTINLSAKIYDASSNLWSPAGTATDIVDTLAPTGETGALDASSRTGFDLNMTSQKSPYYSGTAEANAKVAVTINGKTYNTTADGTGHYVVKVATADALADGKYTPTIMVTDVAGNSSSVTGTAFTVATKPPAVTEALTDATDTGINDGITYNLTPTMEGTTIAGGHVTIKVNGHTYNTTADANGHYAVAIPAADAFSKTPASYVPLITVVDGAGNQVVDKVGQTIQIINTSDTNNKPVVTQVMDDRNSDGVLTPSELAGHNYVTVRAKFPPGIHVGDNIILSNGVDPLAGYNVSTAALAAGYYDFYLPLPAAGVKYTYYATLTDYEGVVVRPAATDCATIVYLNGNPNGGVAPTVTINQDTNHDGYVNAAELGGKSTFTVTATFDPTKVGVGQSVDFTSLNLPAQHVILTAADIANGYVTATYNVPANGTHFSVNAKITDNANGKSSPDGTAADIFDFVAPTGETGALDPISQTGTAANVTASRTPTYSGSAEPNSHVDVTINGHVYSTTADTNGHYSVTVLPAFALTTGTAYTPTIKVTDAAGNSSQVNGTAFTVDGHAPAVITESFQDTGSSATDGVTFNGVISIGTLEAGATWQYRVDGGAWVTGTGTSFTMVDDGAQHVYTVRQVATNGATSLSSDPIVATYDHTAPHVTSIVLDNMNVDANGTANVFITFDSDVVNFTNGSVTATNGYVDGLVEIDHANHIYEGTFHATSTGTGTIDVVASGYEDVAGNAGTAASSTNITVQEDISINSLLALTNAATSVVSGSTVVDLTNGGLFNHQTLTLTLADVTSHSTLTAPLVVNGDATDSVLITNGTGSAVASTTVTFNGHQYSAYDLTGSGHVDLLVEQTMHKPVFSA